MANKIHEGRNVRRFREMMGLKQDALAHQLGSDWNQQKISMLEQKEIIDPAILEQVSIALKLPVEAFQQFDEEQAVNIIANTMSFDNGAIGYQRNDSCNFNSIEEIKKFHEDKIALYERMIKEKDETMARLEKLMERK